MLFAWDGGCLHEHTSNCAHIQAHLFAVAGSSPKRRHNGKITLPILLCGILEVSIIKICNCVFKKLYNDIDMRNAA